MTTVAIMQPYFLPYAGYFRLCAAADLFVLLDDVQFQRRGWVHRNRLRNHDDSLAWLTLPLIKGERDTTRIMDLRFRPTAGEEMQQQLRRFPLADLPNEATRPLIASLCPRTDDVTEYLAAQLDQTCRLLGIPAHWMRSSALGIDPAIRQWQRLVAVARAVGADTYINAPGGRDIYDPADFEREGLRLRFLTPYDGPMESILQRLHDSDPAAVRAEIEQNLRFDDDD